VVWRGREADSIFTFAAAGDGGTPTERAVRMASERASSRTGADGFSGDGGERDNEDAVEGVPTGLGAAWIGDGEVG
jgi:hypothetical protein